MKLTPIEHAREHFYNALDELMLALQSIHAEDFCSARYWAKSFREHMSDAVDWAGYQNG